MISYASVDRIEDNFAVCEVEMVDIKDSRNIDDYDIDTQMVDIPLSFANNQIDQIQEGDILIVLQDDGKVLWIYCKDDKEKQRRLDVLKGLKQKIVFN